MNLSLGECGCAFVDEHQRDADDSGIFSFLRLPSSSRMMPTGISLRMAAQWNYETHKGQNMWEEGEE
jgi:hypothetical protein